jgi:hypothetical protein
MIAARGTAECGPNGFCSYPARRSSTLALALTGQAEVNSTEERRTLRGTSERGLGRDPKRVKKRSGVSVSRFVSAPSSRD